MPRSTHLCIRPLCGVHRTVWQQQYNLEQRHGERLGKPDTLQDKETMVNQPLRLPVFCRPGQVPSALGGQVGRAVARFPLDSAGLVGSAVLKRGDDGKAALLGPSGYVPRGYSAGVTNPSIIESVVAAAAATADKLDGGSMRVRHFSVPQLEVAPNSPNLHTLCISMASDLPKELLDLATFQIGEGQGAAVKSCVQPTTHGLPNPCVPQHDRATSKLQFEGSHSQGESLCDLQRTETGLRERDIVATEAPTHFARVERGSETLLVKMGPCRPVTMRPYRQWDLVTMRPYRLVNMRPYSL
jgi:hypothetical protein